MKKINNLFFLFVISVLLTSCGKAPITGRSQLLLVPESMVVDMGSQNYQSFMQQNPSIVPPTADVFMTKRVGQNISEAVERYMKATGNEEAIKGYRWEFNMTRSPEVNAWCMPGGKVMVYSGIMPLTKDETGLAVVIGHEIGHAVAQHTRERMSQQLAIVAGTMALDVFMQSKPKMTHDIFMTAAGVGSQLGMLAYSRQQEYEADKLGLIFMAMAGYNPERAISFWQDMVALKSKGGKNAPPEYLSTHPSDANRIAAIQSIMPEAMQYYKASTKNYPVKPNTTTKSR